MALIYIVEDDDNIREIETIALKNSNYMVKDFARASDFYKALEVLLPDLVLLDVMLPDENGCDIVRRLRSNTVTKRLPVIMVTAKTSEMDMVKGLDDGADDYIKKPFSVMELLSRVKALLRRTREEGSKQLTVGKIQLDHDRHTVLADGKAVASAAARSHTLSTPVTDWTKAEGEKSPGTAFNSSAVKNSTGIPSSLQ